MYQVHVFRQPPFAIAECGFRIADLRRRVPLSFQYTFRNPKSAIGLFLLCDDVSQVHKEWYNAFGILRATDWIRGIWKWAKISAAKPVRNRKRACTCATPMASGYARIASLTQSLMLIRACASVWDSNASNGLTIRRRRPLKKALLYTVMVRFRKMNYQGWRG